MAVTVGVRASTPKRTRLLNGIGTPLTSGAATQAGVVRLVL